MTCAGSQPARLPIRSVHAKLELIALAVSHRSLDCIVQPVAVFRVYRLAQVGLVIARLRLERKTVQRSHLVRPANRVCGDVPLPQPGLGALQRKAQSLLGDIRLPRRLPRLGKLSDYVHDPANMSVRIAQRIVAAGPVFARARPGQHRGIERHIDDRFTLAQDPLERRSDPSRNLTPHLVDVAPDMVFRRQLVECRQRVVDSHIATFRIEKRKPHRRTGDPALDHLGGREILQKQRVHSPLLDEAA